LGGLFMYFRKRKGQTEHAAWTAAPESAAFFESMEDQLAQGETEAVLSGLIDFFKGSEQEHSQLLTLSAQYHQYMRDYNDGINPPPEILNRINRSIVEMINGFQSRLLTTA
ncbi:MAG: hypothetical protein AAFO94_08590, partial [Bacteroidota bacterium]